MSAPPGLALTAREEGEAVIAHRDRPATPSRGDRAAAFLRGVEGMGEGAREEAMARITGNHGRVGERPAGRRSRDA